ncbi:unnamed protein product [Peronospora belbahrii]|uniref:Uncharacterized protein n=1 Tax=Peronospora belbahrii TaxID=622444 RepID=A0AAU9KVH2_9STRA|nr:unnamed protein product [Peronospora belbahrii]
MKGRLIVVRSTDPVLYTGVCNVDLRYLRVNRRNRRQQNEKGTHLLYASYSTSRSSRQFVCQFVEVVMMTTNASLEFVKLNAENVHSSHASLRDKSDGVGEGEMYRHVGITV